MFVMFVMFATCGCIIVKYSIYEIYQKVQHHLKILVQVINQLFQNEHLIMYEHDLQVQLKKIVEKH